MLPSWKQKAKLWENSSTKLAEKAARLEVENASLRRQLMQLILEKNGVTVAEADDGK